LKNKVIYIYRIFNKVCCTMFEQKEAQLQSLTNMYMVATTFFLFPLPEPLHFTLPVGLPTIAAGTAVLT